jgi:ABC-2 type transport system ATP-binding protein
MKISNVNIFYRKFHVIKDLDLEIIEGAINGLVGMNGAGKTTLLNGVFGLKELSSGQIEFENKPLHSSQIAYLETTNFFYPKIKGQEYLEIFKLSNPKFNIENWNALFELPLDKIVDEYSTGMKKKLALMGVIALDRPLVILDEPFNGVDLESNEKIKLVIQKLSELGKTVIITSHILATLTAICHRISVLYDGRIHLSTNSDEFNLIEEYLHNSISENAQSKIDKIFNEE